MRVLLARKGGVLAGAPQTGARDEKRYRRLAWEARSGGPSPSESRFSRIATAPRPQFGRLGRTSESRTNAVVDAIRPLPFGKSHTWVRSGSAPPSSRAGRLQRSCSMTGRLRRWEKARCPPRSRCRAWRHGRCQARARHGPTRGRRAQSARQRSRRGLRGARRPRTAGLHPPQGVRPVDRRRQAR
jgi:hypothetical protein